MAMGQKGRSATIQDMHQNGNCKHNGSHRPPMGPTVSSGVDPLAGPAVPLAAEMVVAMLAGPSLPPALGKGSHAIEDPIGLHDDRVRQPASSTN